MYEYIEFIICYGEKLTPDQVKDKTREKEVLFPRQLIMFYCVQRGVGTLRKIGELTGGYDHATVLNAVKSINNYIETDREKREKIEYYGMLIEKVVNLRKKAQELLGFLDPIEKDLSELEQRYLRLRLAFLKDHNAISEAIANG